MKTWLPQLVRRWTPSTLPWLARGGGHEGRPRRRPVLPVQEEPEERTLLAVQLTIGSPALFPEGNTSTGSLLFTVTRSEDINLPVAVDFATPNGSAQAGVDYLASKGTLFFDVSQTTATIAVPVIGSTTPQSNRHFGVLRSNPRQPSSTLAFAGQQTFAIGTNSTGTAAGDFNGDGLADVALTLFSGKDDLVAVLLNSTPSGATAPSLASALTFLVRGNPEGVAGADLNGDGRPELVVANSSANTMSVLSNQTVAGASLASSASQQTLAVGTAPASVTVRDVHGDGRPGLEKATRWDRSAPGGRRQQAGGASKLSLAWAGRGASKRSGSERQSLIVTSVVILLCYSQGALHALFLPKMDEETGSTYPSLPAGPAYLSQHSPQSRNARGSPGPRARHHGSG